MLCPKCGEHPLDLTFSRKGTWENCTACGYVRFVKEGRTKSSAAPLSASPAAPVVDIRPAPQDGHPVATHGKSFNWRKLVASVVIATLAAWLLIPVVGGIVAILLFGPDAAILVTGVSILLIWPLAIWWLYRVG